MEMARAQDPRSPRLPEEGNTKTKLQDEPKTAEKDNSEAPFDMKNLEKVQQKISYEEIFARQEKANAEKKKNFQQKLLKTILSLAHFQIIKQDYPQLSKKSINYLYSIAKKAILSKKIVQLFEQQQICRHLVSQDKDGFKKFFSHAMKLIHDHIKDVISSFQKSSEGAQQRIDIKLEVMSLFLRRSKELQQYLPKSTLLFRKVDIFYELYSIKQVRKIKKYYEKFRNKVKYYEQQQSLNEAVDAYYTLFLKRKYLQLQSQSKTPVQSLKKHTQIMQELRLNKKRALLQQNDKTDEHDKQYFTFFFRAIKEASFKRNRLSIQKIKEMVNIFQEIRISEEKPTPNHDKIIYLYKEKQILYPALIIEKYKRYKEVLERLLAKYGGDLSVYKLNLMAYHLTKNPTYTYEQVMKKSFYGKHLYIQRQFFQENIVRVLRKEAQYYQMAYLDKVMQGIEEGRGKGSPIIFVDYFDAGCEQDRMRDQTEKLPPEASLVSAVGFDGLFLCRMYHKKMSIPFFLKEVAQMLQGQSEGGTLVFFDRDFPSSWLKREEVFKLRVNNVLLNVPFIEAIPNPSSRVCKIVWSSVQQRLRAGFQDQAAAFQKAVIARKGSNIKGLVDKEWEKSKKFNLSIEAKRLLSSELPREDNKPEGQGSVKMKAEQAGLKTVRGKRKTVKRQSADVEESDSEAELMDDERQMSDVEQFPSESDSNQASPAPNPSDHPLPHMENIHNMNEEILRSFLPVISNLMPNFRENKFIKTSGSLCQNIQQI